MSSISNQVHIMPLRSVRDYLFMHAIEGELRHATKFEHLHQRSNHAQAGQPQVLEGPGLACGVQEGVQEKRDVGCSRNRLSMLYRLAYERNAIHRPEPMYDVCSKACRGICEDVPFKKRLLVSG